MSNTITIVMPEWTVWLLLILIVLQGIKITLDAYLSWLKSRLAKHLKDTQ